MTLVSVLQFFDTMYTSFDFAFAPAQSPKRQQNVPRYSSIPTGGFRLALRNAISSMHNRVEGRRGVER
jgi:hypothetical protein